MNELLLKLIDMSIKASILIAMILVVRIVFKKIPRKYICVLWALVAIRLVCPVSLESPFSVYTVVNKEVKQNTYIHQMVQPERKQDTKAIAKTEEKIEPVQDVISNEEVHIAPEVKKQQNVEGTSQKTISVATWIWLVGVIAITLYGIVSYLRIKRKVRVSLKKEKNLYVCDEIDSPFILGFIRPNIYVHSGLDPESLEYIVEHEKAHIRRKDYLWKPLGFLLLAIYWFNPMCWLAYMMLCRDIEVACDEKVIAQMDDEGKVKYSEILLKCSSGRRNIMVCPIAFGEVGVKGRIKNVLSYKKPTFWIVLGSVLVCTIVIALFMTNPEQKAENKKVVKKETTTKAVEEQTEPVQEEEFWKDGNIFTAELTRPYEESTLTKKCIGRITEVENNEFNIQIRCDFNKEFDHIDLGNYRIEKDCIYKVNQEAGEKYLIWSQKEVKDKLDEEEKGIHNYVKERNDMDYEGNVIDGCYYNNQVETGYYEHNYFLKTSKKRALYEIESGYGAQADMIQVSRIQLTNDKVVELRNGVGTGTWYSTFYNVSSDQFSEAYYDVIARNSDNVIVFMKKKQGNNKIGVKKLFSKENEREYSVFENPADTANPIDVLDYRAKECVKFINDNEVMIRYCDSDNKSRSTVLNINGYSDQELCQKASEYYSEHNNGKKPPIIEVASVTDDNVVTLHLYEIVKEYEDFPEHTATWDWYEVNRNTGLGENILNEKINLNFSIEDKHLLSVLNNQEKLLNVKTGEKQYLKDYNESEFMVCNEKGKFEYDNSKKAVSENFVLDSFSYVDMDQDGKKEVVLYEKNMGNRVILRTYQNKVYAYSFPYRQMKSIARDGLFDGSSSAEDVYIGRLYFKGEDCYYKQICLMDMMDKKYIVQNKKVSKKEIEDYLLQFSNDTVKSYNLKLLNEK